MISHRLRLTGLALLLMLLLLACQSKVPATVNSQPATPRALETRPVTPMTSAREATAIPTPTATRVVARPADPAAPEILYVFDVTNLHLDHFALCGGPCQANTPPPAGKTHADLLDDYDRLLFLTSLQGIVNREAPQLYLIHHPSDRFWLETYQTPNTPYGWLSNTQIETLPDFDAVVARFASEIEGLVLWDDKVAASLNVATTIAGVEDLAIVRAESGLAAALAGQIPVRKSLRGSFSDNLVAYRWAIDEYLRAGRTDPTLLGYVEDGYPAQKYARGDLTRGGVYAVERDYLIQRRGFAFDLSPWEDEAPADFEMLGQILEAARQEAGLRLIKMWGYIPWYEKYAAAPGFGGSHHPVEGEWESTWRFSYYSAYLQGGGGDAWGAGMANISVHRFAPPTSRNPVLYQPPTRQTLIDRGYLDTDGSLADDKIFLMFYAGDYDLVHPTQIALADGPRSTWHDPQRGTIPLAWGINPGMEEEIPGIMSYMLATRSDLDFWVGANSGAGYINPQGISRRYQQQWLNRTTNYYTKYGITIQGFILNGRGYDLPPEWAERFATLTPVGIAGPDYEIEGTQPRLVNGTPYIGLPKETLGDSVAGSAGNIQTAYQRIAAAGQPPFITIRSAFQTPTFLRQVYDHLHTADPRYTLVDPYTFFALLNIALE